MTQAAALLEASRMVTDMTFCLLRELGSDSGGCDSESAICAAGALAGYACQAAACVDESGEISTDVVLQHKVSEIGVGYHSDARIFFYLVEAEYSVVNIAKKIYERSGYEFDIDVGDIIQHARESVGMPSYGFPRVALAPEKIGSPIAYVRQIWPSQISTILRQCPTAASWPILFGLTINSLLFMAKQRVDPKVGVRLALEAAIPMSMIRL
jgi:hypothetical protein